MVYRKTSNYAILSKNTIHTSGESCDYYKRYPKLYITLDSKTTDHITIKSLTDD